jgi:peptide/nickel transport system permease protein
MEDAEMATGDGVRRRVPVPVGSGASLPAAAQVHDPTGRDAAASLVDVRQRQRISPLRRFAKASPLGAATILVLLIAIVIALVGPVLGTGDPEEISGTARFASPSAEYPMGGDYLGRSVLARLVFGLRISLALAAASALLAAAVGTVLGLISGYFGGTLDELVMRFTDILFAFPTILLGLLVAMVLDPGVSSVVVTIVIATIPIFGRVVRGPTLSVRQAEYTIAARVMGATSHRILFRCVLPNVSTPLLVQLAFTLSGALIAEGALSFLGLGVQPPMPSLGSLLRDGKTYMEIAPWTMLFPGITLAVAILAINLLSDELQAFADPRVRGK